MTFNKKRCALEFSELSKSLAGVIMLLIPLVCGGYERSADSLVYDIHFKTFSVNRIDAELLFKGADGEFVPIETWREVYSNFYRYLGPSPMVLYRLLPPNENGIRKPEPMAEIELGDHRGRSTLILRQSTDGQSVSGILIPSSPDSFPENSFFILNFTEEDIAIKLGNELNKIRSDRYTLIGLDKNRVQDIEILMAKRIRQGKSRLVYSSKWRVSPGVRSIIFLLPRENSVFIKRFDENLTYENERFEHYLRSEDVNRETSPDF